MTSSDNNVTTDATTDAESKMKAEKSVANLQKRIEKATKEGNLKKARSLQKLLRRSSSAKMLGVNSEITPDTQN
jgi:RNA-directed DNA polymerase